MRWGDDSKIKAPPTGSLAGCALTSPTDFPLGKPDPQGGSDNKPRGRDLPLETDLGRRRIGCGFASVPASQMRWQKYIFSPLMVSPWPEERPGFWCTSFKSSNLYMGTVLLLHSQVLRQNFERSKRKDGKRVFSYLYIGNYKGKLQYHVTIYLLNKKIDENLKAYPLLGDTETHGNRIRKFSQPICS